jgi:hypothetical protein
MNKIVITSFPLFLAVLFSSPVMSEDATFRRSNFSNEFNIKTPEGINARGSASVISTQSKHKVKINVNGLKPGETYVILNHWFEPIPDRGVRS